MGTTPNDSTPGGRGWAYAGTILGALTSIAANIADAYVPPKGWPIGRDWTPDIGAVLGSVFWPLALLAASETLARKRWAGKWTRAVGVAAVLVVALAAAVISYQHMHGLLQHYRETDLSAMIGPLAIDGLMIVCSLALVAKDADPDASGRKPADDVKDAPPSGSSPAADTAPDTATTPTRSRPCARTTAAGGSETARKAARLKAQHPDMTPAEIARRLGVTDRTVRRYLASPTTDPTGSHQIGGTPTTTATTTQITTEASADDARAA